MITKTEFINNITINGEEFAIDRTFDENNEQTYRLTSGEGYEIATAKGLDSIMHEAIRREGEEFCDHCGAIGGTIEYHQTFRTYFMCYDCLDSHQEGLAREA